MIKVILLNGMRNITTVFCLLLSSHFLLGQSLNGHWDGFVTMEGYQGRFLYHINIEEEGNTINGMSVSMTADSATQVQFQLAGSRQANKVTLQEIRQITAPPPEWCLKYQQLELVSRHDSVLLIGNWSGGVCRPGRIYLAKRQVMRADTIEQVLPFTKVGKWTGHLDQSDRAYGFFYEIELEADGTGSSFIVSEGSGGSAYHDLVWSFDQKKNQILLTEQEVIERTDPNWKWCIKEATLNLEKEATGYQLSGDWQGHIENDFSEKGKCAPGKMVLHKPVLTEKIVQQIATSSQAYELELSRKVQINQIIEVSRSKLKLGVWDNGVVDGDIMTLYLNGEKIMEHHQVRKRKVYIDVELKARNNFLVLHADDLGEVSPNTVAISIFDGQREQILVMSSNLDESGAVLIKRIDLEKD